MFIFQYRLVSSVEPSLDQLLIHRKFFYLFLYSMNLRNVYQFFVNIFFFRLNAAMMLALDDVNHDLLCLFVYVFNKLRNICCQYLLGSTPP